MVPELIFQKLFLLTVQIIFCAQKLKCKTTLSITPVAIELFNVSLKLGEIPDEWKIARVAPIPKPQNKPDPKNYRPITLLSVLSKLFEKHVKNLLITVPSLPYQQWSFIHGKSTTGALLAATDWHRQLDSGYDICAVYFYFSKAFDTVPHKPLL